MVRGGLHVSARGDISIVGPLRVRIEGSSGHWNVTGQSYDSATVSEKTSVGSIGAQQVGAAVGIRGGEAPVCWHGLVGGGSHSLRFRDATLRRPGKWFMADH
jgi:hypothetical protein